MSAVTIECLPPEVVLKIFEYLTPEDLINVQDVCIRWKTLAQTSSVWETFVYSPDEDMTDEDLIKFLEKCPMVKHISISRMPDKDKFVPAVIKNCFDICSFQVEFMPTLTVPQIDALFEAFPNLDCFLIRVESPDATRIVERLSRCKKLKKLTLSGQYCRNGVFKPIVDGCISLHCLSFNGGFPNVSEQDLLYVLKNMNDRLLFLRYGFSPTTQQIIDLLATFTKLEDLALHDAKHRHVVDFKPLARIKTLKCLKLESFASESSELSLFLDVLFEEPFPLLEKLDICFFHCKYDVTIIRKICHCYPNLKYLHLYGHHPSDIKDGFKYICDLEKLESLGFSSSDAIKDCDTKHLAKCRKLKNLELSSNPCLTDESLNHIAKCHALEILDLSYSSLSGKNLHLIADNLKRLKYLDIKQCKNMNVNFVSALAECMPSLKIVTEGGIRFA